MNVSGTSTWGGNIQLNSGTAIGGTAGTEHELTVNGVVSGTDLTEVGPTGLILANSNTFTGALTINGGAVTLSNTNIYTGATTINGAIMASGSTTINGSLSYNSYAGGSLTLNSFGTASNTPSFTVNASSVLKLDNSTVNLSGNGSTTSGTLAIARHR